MNRSSTGLLEPPAASPAPSSPALSPSSHSVPPPIARRERTMGKFARTIVFAVLMLICIEVAVRGRAILRRGQVGTQADIYADDTELGTAPRPGATMVHGGAVTTVNRWGLRGHDFALAKSPGVLRVLCLGESTTFGQPTDDDGSVWPARLEGALGAEGRRVEVLNGAVIGYNVGQSRLRYERELARFAPDVVVICHASTGISAHARRQYGSPTEGGTARLSLGRLRDEYSLAYNLLRANTAAFLAEQFPAGRSDRLDDKGVLLFASELERLIEECRSNGAEVVLCTFPRAFSTSQPGRVQRAWAQTALFFNPSLSVAGLEDAYERYNDAIRSLAKASGVALVDLDRAVPREASYFIDSVHFSKRGHEAVAEAVEACLTNGAAMRVTDAGGPSGNAVQ